MEATIDICFVVEVIAVDNCMIKVVDEDAMAGKNLPGTVGMNDKVEMIDPVYETDITFVEGTWEYTRFDMIRKP
jgi:hypothetical protein